MVGNLTPKYTDQDYRLEGAVAPSRGQAIIRSATTYWDGAKVCATENSPNHLGAYDDEHSDAGQYTELNLEQGRRLAPVRSGRFYCALSATVAALDQLITADDGGYKNDSGVDNPNIVGVALEAGDSGDVILAEYGTQSDQQE